MATSLNNIHTVAIAPTTAAATSEAFELRASGSMQNPVNYSLISSALGTGEEVAVQIWNEADQAWQAMNRDGAAVKLIKDHDWLTFDSVSLRVRFVKGVTVAAVGVSLVSPRGVV
jgi:hypothetical protein